MDTDPCWCMATDACQAWPSEAAWVGISPRLTGFSSLALLFQFSPPNAQTVLSLFLSHLSTTYLHIVVVPAAGRPFMPGEALGDLCGCHMAWLQTGLCMCMCSVVAGRFVSKVFLQCQPGLEAQAFSPSYS